MRSPLKSTCSTFVDDLPTIRRRWIKSVSLWGFKGVSSEIWHLCWWPIIWISWWIESLCSWGFKGICLLQNLASLHGVHMSDKDSTSASICGCKATCVTRLYGPMYADWFSLYYWQYCHPNRTCVNRKLLKPNSIASVQNRNSYNCIDGKVWTTTPIFAGNCICFLMYEMLSF